jgi:hypothetical protein
MIDILASGPLQTYPNQGTVLATTATVDYFGEAQQAITDYQEQADDGAWYWVRAFDFDRGFALIETIFFKPPVR